MMPEFGPDSVSVSFFDTLWKMKLLHSYRHSIRSSYKMLCVYLAIVKHNDRGLEISIVWSHVIIDDDHLSGFVR